MRRMWGLVENCVLIKYSSSSLFVLFCGSLWPDNCMLYDAVVCCGGCSSLVGDEEERGAGAGSCSGG